MAVVRFLCKIQMEIFCLSSSPGSSTVGATGAALLWAHCHYLPCNGCSHFPFVAIFFLSTGFPTQCQNLACQEHLHRLVTSKGIEFWMPSVICTQWISVGASHWALWWQLLVSHHPTPLLSDVSALSLRKITIFTSSCSLPFSSIRGIQAGKLIADLFFGYQFHC